MPPNTPRPITRIDPKKKAWEQEPILHNRWHPDIPAVGVIGSSPAVILKASVRSQCLYSLRPLPAWPSSPQHPQAPRIGHQLLDTEKGGSSSQHNMADWRLPCRLAPCKKASYFG